MTKTIILVFHGWDTRQENQLISPLPKIIWMVDDFCINVLGCLIRLLKGWQSPNFPQALSPLSEKCVLKNFQPDFYSSPFFFFCTSLTTMKCSGVTITVNEPKLSTFVNIRALKYRKGPKSLLKVGTQLKARHNILSCHLEKQSGMWLSVGKTSSLGSSTWKQHFEITPKL